MPPTTRPQPQHQPDLATTETPDDTHCDRHAELCRLVISAAIVAASSMALLAVLSVWPDQALAIGVVCGCVLGAAAIAGSILGPFAAHAQLLEGTTAVAGIHAFVLTVDEVAAYAPTLISGTTCLGFMLIIPAARRLST